jgi:hypothetical protein
MYEQSRNKLQKFKRDAEEFMSIKNGTASAVPFLLSFPEEKIRMIVDDQVFRITDLPDQGFTFLRFPDMFMTVGITGKKNGKRMLFAEREQRNIIVFRIYISNLMIAIRLQRSIVDLDNDMIPGAGIDDPGIVAGELGIVAVPENAYVRIFQRLQIVPCILFCGSRFSRRPVHACDGVIQS